MTTPEASPIGQANPLTYTCEEAMPRLYDYIDNELTLEELQAMQDHIDGCESCTYEHRVRVKLKQIISESCFEPAPEGLRERVAARLAALHAQSIIGSGS